MLLHVDLDFQRRPVGRLAEGGSAAVEFAPVAPLHIGLLLGIAQVGVVVMHRTAATDAARDVARAVSLGRLDLAAAGALLGQKLDRLLPDSSVDGGAPLPPTYSVYEQGDAVVVDITIPLRDLLWSPVIGEALGSIELTVRTIKP